MAQRNHHNDRMNASFLETAELAFEESIGFLKLELSQLRTGRATPALVEHINVDAYGSIMPIKGVASISVTDARSMAIEPWDKSLLKAVEEAIRNANIGINPVNDGKAVRINMPAMTEENRKQLTKMVGQRAEDTRIKLRQSRDEVRTMIIEAETKKEILEDERYALCEKLDVLAKECNERIKTMADEKEREIMTM